MDAAPVNATGSVRFYLAGNPCEAPIPLCKDNVGQGVGPASEDWLRHLKHEVQERSGVKFRGWKTMRATLCQSAIDGGAPVEAVSKAMRHGTKLTTETYYGRIRSERSRRLTVPLSGR